MPTQLLPAPQKPPVERLLADCRIYERKTCELPTTCQPASALEMKEMRWAATICDISLGGVRLLLQRRFEKGTGLAIELPGDAEREPTVVFVKVVHVHTLGNGTWGLGCRFISELSEDEMQRLLESTHHVLSSDRAEDADEDQETPEDEVEAAPLASELRVLTRVHLLVKTGDGTSTEFTIRRLNVTKCWPLATGKILSLNGQTSEQTPWAIRIRVTECRPQGDGWEIEGQAVESTTHSGIIRTVNPR